MTVKPSTIFTGDNLEIMRGMDDETVDLIYLDPPFKSDKDYAAPIGSKAAGAAFKDTWTLSDVDDAWHGEIADANPAIYNAIAGSEYTHGKGMKAYLIMMAVRLIEMHRILKSTGSIYLHCDPTASHYLKVLMDSVFGQRNFRNEIAWCYRGMPSSAKKWQQKHDIILFYAKSSNSKFNVLLGEPTEGSKKTFASGKRIGYNANLSKKMVTVFDWDKYQKAVDAGKIPSDLSPKEFTGGKPPMRDWWDDIKILGGPKNKEKTGYPTQKPLALLQRIIRASTEEGDLVLDPFCGCATACLAAQIERRNWIGIDLSEKAYQLINARLKKELGGIFAKPIHRTDIPKRKGAKPSKDIKHKLFGQQEGRCNGCNDAFNFRNFHIDHIVPTAKGGSDSDDNLQLLCGWCNSKKGDRPMAYLIAELKADGIYSRQQAQ